MAQYEFSAEENGTIGTTGARAKVWGICSIVFGVLQMLMGLVTLPRAGFGATVSLAGGVVSIVVGITILGAGTALKGVVETKGNDIGHMMGAMKKLTTAYTIQTVVVCVGFSVGFISGFLGLR